MSDKKGTLGEIREKLMGQFKNATLKGGGRGSFIYVTHEKRAVEISALDDGQWWLEFWDDKEDGSPVKEITVDTSERAIAETIQWLDVGGI